jgi:hypothetical protein
MQHNIPSAPYAVLLAICLGGCTTGPDPELQTELDRLLRGLETSDRTYTGTLPFEPRPLAVGQWVEYLAFDETDDPFLIRQEVVGEENDAFWLQQTKTTYYDKSSTKILVANFHSEDPNQLEIRRVLQRDRDGDVEEVEGLAPEIREQFFAQLRFKVAGEVPITLKVPAGTFANTVTQQVERRVVDPQDRVQQWFNSEVPLWGVVKACMAAGNHRWELIGLGVTGAKDLFAQ